MPGLGRWRLEVVVQHVEVADWRVDQLLRVDAVEAVYPHCVEPVALAFVAVRERPHAALRAEHVVDGLPRELVFAKVLLPGKQAERVRRNERHPRPRLEADRAVALAGARGEIDVRFESDRPAVAAASVRSFHFPHPLVTKVA